MRLHVMVLMFACLWPACPATAGPSPAARRDFDPRGQIHIPIGLADSLDSLKTFVEPEGCFSPGFATYGVCFILQDAAGKVNAPTAPGVSCSHTLMDPGYLVPRFSWATDQVTVQTQLSQVEVKAPGGRSRSCRPRSP